MLTLRPSTLDPELTDSCKIVSSAGYVAEIDFSGKKMLGLSGEKNHVVAQIYRSDDVNRKDALFKVEGNWTESLVFKDSEGSTVETYDVASASSTEFRTLPLDQQDPWESRKAWNGVISSINAGDMRGVAEYKNKLVNAQREMRKKSESCEETWKGVFFEQRRDDPVAEKLLSIAGESFDPDSTCGVWKIDRKKAIKCERPFRGKLTPQG